MLGLFLDIESTGLDPRKHETIDIGIAVVDLSRNSLLESYQSVIAITPEQWERRDPRSIAINGFTWEMVQGGKNRNLVAAEIIALFGRHEVARGNAFFICQNPTFDRAFFSNIIEIYTQEQFGWPYHWLDLASMYWAERMRQWRRQGQPIPETFSVSKDDIAAYYQLPPEAKPHRAYKGVEHLLLCYQTMQHQPLAGVLPKDMLTRQG